MTGERRRNIAYCTCPRPGGTFRLYRTLSNALEPLGWTVWGVTAGSEASRWDDRFADEHCVKLGDLEDDLKTSARLFAEWVADNDVDIVIPMSSRIGGSAVPHLPASVQCVMQCSSITRHAYEIIVPFPQHVWGYAVLSKRQQNDLIRRHNVNAARITIIPNALHHEPFAEAAAGRAREADDTLRIVYLGRIIHKDKGVFHIPRILRCLDALDVPYTLEIAGDGPDLPRLQARLKPWADSGRVVFHGTILHDAVPAFLAKGDAFLMPSNFEGFPFALIEAMAAGCIPVASKIAGVTDWILQDGTTGFVCPIGNADSFARALARLQAQPEERESMSRSARSEVEARYTLEMFGRAYNELFNRVLENPLPRQPEPWDRFKLSPGFAPTWRRFVPEKMKIWLRRIEETIKARK